MANEGAIESLIGLLVVNNDLVQRQSAKALANLGVNADNKPKIAAAGGIPKLIALAGNSAIPVKIEAIAALANLAVNGTDQFWSMDALSSASWAPLVHATRHVAVVALKPHPIGPRYR
jgi:hypothetical protein